MNTRQTDYYPSSPISNREQVLADKPKYLASFAVRLCFIVKPAHSCMVLSESRKVSEIFES